MPSKKHRKKSNKQSWGTPEDYFQYEFPIAPIETSDLEAFQQLSPSERIAWLLTIQELIRLHHKTSKS